MRVVGVVLVDGEVVLIEKVEQVGKELARKLRGDFVERVALKKPAVEIRHFYLAALRQSHLRVEEIIIGCAVGIKAFGKERFEHRVEKVLLLRFRGALKEAEHKVLVALAPRLACRHAEPAFLLQEMQEDDAPEEFLHIVAHALVVPAEVGIHLRVRLVRRLFQPLAAGFDKALARDVFHKPLVVLLVFPEKLVGERFDVKRRLDVLQFYVARLAKELAKVVGHGAAALIGPEQEGVTLAVGKGIVCGLAAK